eukprot:TRINITY_DN1663_c0_g1_i2.p1 TRINITY_DN1663_c0_g1~~TRINITY_DN1663_c0_g1_i2.p1  ORF type:complete len:548 (+),score=79.82 TRINITY_DN1663_c0_g1_i2:3454-5097(+)
MKLAPLGMPSMQKLGTRAFAVIFALAIVLAIVSAQERKTDNRSSKPDVAAPDPLDQAIVRPIADSKIPDITGLWRVQPEGMEMDANLRAVIRRSDDSSAFLVMGEAGNEKTNSLKVKWSETARQFEGTAAFGDPAIPCKQTMRPLADGKTMRVDVDLKFDETTKKKYQDEGIELIESHPQVWTRVEKEKLGVNQETSQEPSPLGGAGEIPPHDHGLPADTVEVPSLAGVWQGGEWGIVKIELQDAPGGGSDGLQFGGTYHEIESDRVLGNFVIRLSERRSGHYEGVWKEKNDRQGRLSVRVLADGETIRGSWTTDAGATTNTSRPEFGDLEWVRMGRSVSNASRSATKPSGGGQGLNFTLENSSAVECRKYLQDLYGDIEIIVDAHSNSIRIVSPVESRLRAIETDVRNFDKSQPKIKKFRRIPESSFTPSAALVEFPGAFELLATLSQQEATADVLAEEIRQLANTAGDQNSQLVKAKRNLEQTLTDALKVKFKLETLQIKLLEEQLELLKMQVSRRHTISRQIVQRRVRELTEENSKWNPLRPTD